MAGIAETQFRIVLLGRTGDGKSQTGNTILGENVFTASNGASSETSECKLVTRDRNHSRITVIDTPGFFDTNLSEETLKREILKCMVMSAPGPHAFIIVLRLCRFTKQEREVVKYLDDLFGEEALRYTVVVFNRGDELEPNQTLHDFVQGNIELESFVNKCGGGCHVIDNKYWNQSQDRYRNNTVQIDNIFRSIEDMVMTNGGCYTNQILQMVQARKQEEEQAQRREQIQVQPVIQRENMIQEAVVQYFFDFFAPVPFRELLRWLFGNMYWPFGLNPQ